jgi:acyl-homoserine lactone acylase PvdQ
MPLMVGADRVLKELFDEPKKNLLRPGKSVLRAAFRSDALSRFHMAAGSNAFAVSPKRAADGKTLLNINSHQPWEGPVTWYEVQVHSEEGWNMTAAYSQDRRWCCTATTTFSAGRIPTTTRT